MTASQAKTMKTMTALEKEISEKKMQKWLEQTYPGSTIEVSLQEIEIPAEKRIKIYLTGKTEHDTRIIKHLTTHGMPGLGSLMESAYKNDHQI